MNIENINVKLRLTCEILELIDQGGDYQAEIRDIQISEDDVYCESLILDYTIIELCQQPVNDIRKVELLEICIYENRMPDIIAMRQDFPVLPHVIAFTNDETKYLCIVDETYDEVKHKLSGRFLLDCIDRWFILSARGELHRSDQPLEPFFPSVKDNIIISLDFLEYRFASFRRIETNGVETWIQSDYISPHPDDSYYSVIPLSLDVSDKNIINSLPSTLHELNVLFPNQKILDQTRECLKHVVSVQRNPTSYKALFDQSSRRLRNSQCLIFLHIPLTRERKRKPEKADIRVVLIEEPLSEIIKNLGLRMEKSNLIYEQEKDYGGRNLTLRFFNVHEHFSRELACLLNDREADKLKMLQIGLGAIGSQIYENCVRSGFGEWTLVDDDILFPHNLARHSLNQYYIGRNKAKSMARYSYEILFDTCGHYLEENIMHPKDEDKTQTVLSDSDIIIDTSASPAVERYLSLDIDSPAQRISFFMNPMGDSAIMLSEDVNRKITLDLLEMEYYKKIATDARYLSHTDSAGKISYSATCRSISSRIPQDNISMFSALCSKALKKYAKSETAQAIIWSLEGESVASDVLDCEEYESLTHGQWKVQISKKFLNSMYLRREGHYPKETGGVLIGSYDFSRNIVYIVDDINPSDNVESPTSFIRGCNGLLNQVMDISRKSFGYLNYIGEWHSHPSSDTSKSSKDEIVFNSIIDWNRINCLPGCMMIVGPDVFSIYINS